MRINLKTQLINLVLLMLLQLPLVYRAVLFNSAFAFFYVGFLLLLPRTLSRSYLMIVGFFSGLLVDFFTNTPGIHASASVFMMYVRNFWLATVNDDVQEVNDLNTNTLKKTGFLLFVFPLVLVHHFIIFIIENGGFAFFGNLSIKAASSALLSTVVVFIVTLLFSPRERRI